jgi:hypothetical protein
MELLKDFVVFIAIARIQCTRGSKVILNVCKNEQQNYIWIAKIWRDTRSINNGATNCDILSRLAFWNISYAPMAWEVKPTAMDELVHVFCDKNEIYIFTIVNLQIRFILGGRLSGCLLKQSSNKLPTRLWKPSGATVISLMLIDGPGITFVVRNFNWLGGRLIDGSR